MTTASMIQKSREERDAEIINAIGLNHIKSREKQVELRNFFKAALFMLPALILVVGVLLVPVLYNVWTSFTKWKQFKGWDEFAGWANYQKMSTNPFFGDALANTGIWVVASIVFPLVIGLGFALIFRNAPFSGFFKNIIFLPRILAPTAVGILWYYVYAPDGILNYLIGLFVGGDVDTGWLYEAGTVTPSIVVAFLWQTVGLSMVLLILGLAAIPRDPIQAAQIDGATRFQIFRHITLPLLMPTILVVTILSVLAGFTAFDLLWVMGNSYPRQRTLSLAVFMYFEAFQKGNWAFGSAVAVTMGIVVLAVTWVQAWVQQYVDKRIH